MPSESRSEHEFGEMVCLRHELNQHCGTLEILQLLNDEGQATKYAMAREVHPTANGIRSSVEWLEWLGLVERVPGPSRSKPYRLTEQGGELVNSPLRTWPRWLIVRRSRTPGLHRIHGREDPDKGPARNR